MVLGDNYPNVSNPNKTLYNFNTYHINFFLNEHIKLDETSLDVQSRLKAYLSNPLDVLGRLTSKLIETLNTAYKWYINSFKNLKKIIKHLQPPVIHLGDLVVKRLSRLLTFDFQHP